VPFSPVDHGVNEEEPAKEYAGQYSEPEPEDPYREQEAAAAAAYVSKGKFHRPPYVSGCIHVRTSSCSPGLGSITYTST
jgi:hypothetical protein